MYVRVKRRNQTYFIVCTTEDTAGFVKEQIALASKESWKAGQMRLILPSNNAILEDDDKLQQYQEITNDSELHVVFQISENEWEGVDVESTQISGES